MFRLFLVLVSSLSLVFAQPVITFTEFTGIQCGSAFTQGTCVGCPQVSNITLPVNFFQSAVNCVRVANFSDNSLAYSSFADSLALIFYEVSENINVAPQCTAANMLFSLVIPTQSSCGPLPVLTHSVAMYSVFDFYNTETSLPAVIDGPAVPCGTWTPLGGNTVCPLEYNHNSICPNVSSSTGSYAGFVSVIAFNLTLYNQCPSSCVMSANSVCTSTGAACVRNANAMAAPPTASITTMQQTAMLCGCFQSQYACQMSAGCSVGGGAGMGGTSGFMSGLSFYCGSNAPLSIACNGTTAAAAPTPSTVVVNPTPVNVAVSTSDFGGAFGGAIVGTFVMHVITALAIYARKRMWAQKVTVSNRPMTEETGTMINQG